MAVVNTDTDQAHLAELRREFGQYAGKGGLALELGDVYAMRRIARKIKSLLKCKDSGLETESASVKTPFELET